MSAMSDAAQSAVTTPLVPATQVFLSWSGETSRRIAEYFLPLLDSFAMQGFLSIDIPKGANWLISLMDALDASKMALAFITSDSLNSAWVLFECGAIFARFPNNVCPVIVGVDPETLPHPFRSQQYAVIWPATTQKPVSQEDLLRARSEFERLLRTLNTNSSRPLPARALAAMVDSEWPKFLDLLMTCTSPPVPVYDDDPETPLDSLTYDVARLTRRSILAHVKLEILSNTVTSAAYFLNRNYELVQANAAATLLFGLPDNISPENPYPLTSFLANISERITNYDKVCERFTRFLTPPDTAPAIDHEEVILDHRSYGRLVLQKVAVAVLGPGPVFRKRAWVVSLNITSAKRLRDLHRDLRSRMESELKSLIADARSGLPQPDRSQLNARLASLSRTERGVRYEVVTSSDLAIQCHSLMRSELTTKRYGLVDYSILDEQYGSHHRFTWLAARDQTGTLLGTFRLEEGVDVSEYPGLFDKCEADLKDFVLGSKVLVDAAAFYGCVSDRQKWVFRGLFSLLIRYVQLIRAEGIYIQAKPMDVRTFKKMGFQVIGQEFAVKGWVGQWRPMLLRVDRVMARINDPDFLIETKRWSGVPIDVDFWTTVLDSQESL